MIFATKTTWIFLGLLLAKFINLGCPIPDPNGNDKSPCPLTNINGEQNTVKNNTKFKRETLANFGDLSNLLDLNSL